MKDQHIHHRIRRSVLFMVAGSSLASVCFSTLGETIGSPLIHRQFADIDHGQVYIYHGNASPFQSHGKVSTWAFFDDRNAGLSVTPLVFKVTGTDVFTLTGVGATRVSAGTGLQSFSFDLIAGSPDVSPGQYTFGFANRAYAIRGTALVAGTANTGVIAIDRPSAIIPNDPWIVTAEVSSGGAVALTIGTIIGAGGIPIYNPMDPDPGGPNRVYSAQATVLPTASLGTHPAWSITDFVTCENAKMVAPHDWHVPKAVFRTGDSKVFAWAELTNVSGVHSVEMKLYRPDGIYYGKETQVTHEPLGSSNWWRMSAWWGIKGDKMAETPGRWKLDLLIEGTLQRSIYFILNSENPKLALPVQPAGNEAGVCILEASSDLMNWTPIQTNALPAGLAWETLAVKRVFRLTLRNQDAPACILETSADQVNWTPIQTNGLPSVPPSDTPGPPRTAAQFYRALVH